MTPPYEYWYKRGRKMCSSSSSSSRNNSRSSSSPPFGYTTINSSMSMSIQQEGETRNESKNNNLNESENDNDNDNRKESKSTTTTTTAAVSMSMAMAMARNVTILSRGPNHILAWKPPSVVCHHSNWAGSRSNSKKKKKKKLLANGTFEYVYEEPEIPMLQRVRDAIHSIDYGNDSDSENDSYNDNANGDTPNPNGHDHDHEIEMKRINLVHRLDRGASGILLCAFANENEHDKDDDNSTNGSIKSHDDSSNINNDSDNSNNTQQRQRRRRQKMKGPTAILQEEMSKSTTTKTYVALVRGEGILKGEDLKKKGWFQVDRPIKDEKGRLNDATTLFRFVASQAEPLRLRSQVQVQEDGNNNDENNNENNNDVDDHHHNHNHDHDEYETKRIQQPRMSLVLARPQHGRWHQIRRHLNGLSHPILGDTSHGSSKTNREWKEQRNLPGERICLHLARLQMEPTPFTPHGIDCSCPLQEDILNMLRVYAPGVLEEALPVLREEGILIDVPDDHEYIVGTYNVPKIQGDDDHDDHDDDDENGKYRNKKSIKEDNVQVLSMGDTYVVVGKPPRVVVHNSSWTAKRRNEPTPMLQQVRDALGRKVNPLHRLDRSASGCLVFAFANDDNDKNNSEEGENSEFGSSREVTNTLINAMQNEDAVKTYIALVDGDGQWNGNNFMDKGWFTINSPVKDENGKLMNDAETDILFVTGTTLPPADAGEDMNMNMNMNMNKTEEGRKVSIVLARPKTGKYHQIRQHLSSGYVGHAILGDSSHGRSRTNRIWKKKRHLMKERTCLHLVKIEIPGTKCTPSGIEAFCPLPDDLMVMLDAIPGLLDKARPT
eukprot:CAMPEP_0203662882 /NCGR_PEP_ID=MMETSP0090-20130426/687_1 /ASSEMBLY_ACC=CAM_ASM_001088 /TAXON_ID=426623 /ORGANISM="Chaetoceros affinis, Strain CCMP159" /LENGTH=831 /DNA_ID=CAMNT_0050525721 /DNA_START=408 /DNA_END=2900 /DNA_ORIENTATION=-